MSKRFNPKRDPFTPEEIGVKPMRHGDEWEMVVQKETVKRVGAVLRTTRHKKQPRLVLELYHDDMVRCLYIPADFTHEQTLRFLKINGWLKRR